MKRIDALESLKTIAALHIAWVKTVRPLIGHEIMLEKALDNVLEAEDNPKYTDFQGWPS